MFWFKLLVLANVWGTKLSATRNITSPFAEHYDPPSPPSPSPPRASYRVPSGGGGGAAAANTFIFNVIDYGAVGDGIADDTLAIAKAVNACVALNKGMIFFPSGLYLITATIPFGQSGAIEVAGEGWDSNILWGRDLDLFVWTTSTDTANHITIRDLAISSINQEKSPSSTALKFVGGIARSLIDHVLFYGSGTIPGTSINTFFVGTGIDMGLISDTTTVRDCLIWFLTGNGVKIGKGSEIRIEGGRIVGDNSRTRGIGVYVTGNNGGVHVMGTDVIALGTGMRLDDSNGQGSNREIFISQATFDSCGTGFAVADNSYVDITGIWAASSNIDQIWVSPQSTGATLVLTGGTIFNGGALGGDPSTQNNGITVNAGSFSLTGVAVRDNKGRGVWVPNGSVSHYSVTGCRVYDNGYGFELSGSNYLISNNVVYNNGNNNFGSGSGSLVINNIVQ